MDLGIVSCFVLIVSLSLGEVTSDDHIIDLLDLSYRPDHTLYKARVQADAISSLSSLLDQSTWEQLSAIDAEQVLRNALEDSTISEPCVNASIFLIDLLGTNRSLQTIKVFDSWGKIGSGLLDGHTKYKGDFDECLDATISNDVYNESSLIDGDLVTNYCTAYLPVSVPFKATLQFGVCVPKQCTSLDVTTALNLTIGLVIPKVFALCQDQDRTLTTGSTAALVVVLLIVAVCTFATIFDGVLQFLHFWSTQRSQLLTNGEEDTTVLLTSSNKAHPTENGELTKAILTFSFYTNAVKLLSTEQPKGAINCLNGIRFFSMTWVILGHTIIFYCASNIDNGTFVLELMHNFATQAVYSATLSVDTFFVLSGLLVAYLFLKDFHRRQISPCDFFKALPLIYLHRYVRLTPAYGFMILVATALGWYIWDGPEWPNPITGPYRVFDQNCPNNWYLNLLYVNNLFETDKQCAGWGWYLANDTQFFLAAPFFVYLLYLSTYVGVAVGATSILVSVLAAVWVSDVQRTTITSSSFAHYNFTQPSSPSHLTLYTSPWTRYQSYGVGLMAGYLIWQLKNSQFRISKPRLLILNAVLWAVAACLCMSVVYGTYSAQQGYHIISLTEAVSYNSLSRVSWSIGLSCVILSCSMGYGGWVNDFLSWRAFVPLSRLTYCAYLIHLPIMYILRAGVRSGSYYTYVTMSKDILLIIAVAYLIAFPFSLLFEAPFIGLDKLFLTPMSLKGAATTTASSKPIYADNEPLQASSEDIESLDEGHTEKSVPS